MTKETTAVRLRRIMDERNLRQVDVLRMCEPICRQHDVRLGRNDLSQYLSGVATPRQDKLSISWDYRQDADVQKVVSRIPSVRMGRYGEAEAPVSAWESILEMAELNDFRISPGAQEAIAEYRSKLEVVSPTAGAEKVYESHDDALRKILDSSRDVLDDLKEENG